MTDPMVLSDLRAYWRSLAPDGQVPRRSDVNPMALGDAIESCMILERVAPGIARIRVAGRQIGGLLGTEPRGLPLSVAFQSASRATLSRRLEEAFQTPSAVELPLVARGSFLEPKLDGRLLLLPLRDGFGRVTRCLAALVASGQRGTGPRRFDIPQAEGDQQPIHHLKVVDLPEPLPRTMKKAESRPTLRLVVDNC